MTLLWDALLTFEVVLLYKEYLSAVCRNQVHPKHALDTAAKNMKMQKKRRQVISFWILILLLPIISVISDWCDLSEPEMVVSRVHVQHKNFVNMIHNKNVV